MTGRAPPSATMPRDTAGTQQPDLIARIITTIDIALSGDAYLSFEQDPHAGIGWWLIEGRHRRRISLPDVLRLAPPLLRREVIREAQELVDIIGRHSDRPELATMEWRDAVDTLQASLPDAREHIHEVDGLGDTGTCFADRLMRTDTIGSTGFVLAQPSRPGPGQPSWASTRGE